jgi:hypothetical protein
MLYDMFGDDYEDMIETFMENLHRHYKEDLGLDELFIEFGKFLEDCEITRAALNKK